MAANQKTFKISDLRDITNLDGKDLFLVSDHTDNSFHTRKLSASVLFEKIQNNVIGYLSANETFLEKLAVKIVEQYGSNMTNAISPSVITQVTPQVVTSAIPNVVSSATPNVSAEAYPILMNAISETLSNETIPSITIDVTNQAIGIVSSEVITAIIPEISDDLAGVTIEQIINSNEISTAIIDKDTPIGYGVYNAVSANVSDAIGDIAVDAYLSAGLSAAVLETISANASEVWDLFDGIDDSDNINRINAGGAI